MAARAVPSPMRDLAAFAAFCLALTALAGCTGEGTGTSVPSVDLAGRSLGGLAGTVTTDELVPLVGATVAADGVEAVTDPTGYFLLADLTPGILEVTASAPGYFRVVQEVRVDAGAVAESAFALAPMPSDDPYVEIFVLAGFSTCEYALFLSVSTIDGNTGMDCPFGDPKRSVIQNISESWRYGTVEMRWQTADSFALYIADDQNCLTSDPCYGIKFGGHSPLRLDMEPNSTELAEAWASDGKAQYPAGAWEMWANTIYIGMYRDEWGSVTDSVCRGPGVNYKPGCPSWGLSTGIKFETYVTVFNWEKPRDPAAWSALPDA